MKGGGGGRKAKGNKKGRGKVNPDLQAALEKWEPVIGIEIHAQLSSSTKVLVLACFLHYLLATSSLPFLLDVMIGTALSPGSILTVWIVPTEARLRFIQHRPSTISLSPGLFFLRPSPPTVSIPSQAYCSCSTLYSPDSPNTNVCPVCLGEPGSLPVPNARVVELSAKAGMALGCNIAAETKWDRKVRAQSQRVPTTVLCRVAYLGPEA